MEKLQIDQKSGEVLRMLCKCSEVFFQLKLNQKYIYNVIIRPKLSVVGKREDSKIYPPQPPNLPRPIPGVTKMLQGCQQYLMKIICGKIKDWI